MKVRLFAILGSMILAVGTVIGLITSPAFASTGSGYQWESGSGQFVNAWNQGPYVNVYNAQALNNDFTECSGGCGIGASYELFTSTGNTSSPYYGYCVSDNGNNQFSARAALNNCTSTIPWGGNMVFDYSVCGPGFVAIKDVHWNGWIGPSGTGNGSAYYLNQSSPTCYVQVNPY